MSVPYGQSDLDTVFFSDFGVCCRWNGQQVAGILDEEDVAQTDVVGQTVLVTGTVLRVPSAALAAGGAWAGLQEDADVVVEDRTFRVREVRREGDGAVTVLTLVAV